MGSLASKALRPIRNFNIANRAERVLAKEKPVPAPKYPSNYEDIQRALESDPQLVHKLNTKDSNLDDRLKNVYVTSRGAPEDDLTKKAKQDPNRPLPHDRKMVEDFEFGFKEPERIPYGKTTLRQVMQFLSAYQANPTEVTPVKIAFEHKLKEEDVENIVKYFKTFEVYVPETPKAPARFAGPSQVRKLNEDSKKKIESGEETAASSEGKMEPKT